MSHVSLQLFKLPFTNALIPIPAADVGRLRAVVPYAVGPLGSADAGRRAAL